MEAHRYYTDNYGSLIADDTPPNLTIVAREQRGTATIEAGDSGQEMKWPWIISPVENPRLVRTPTEPVSRACAVPPPFVSTFVRAVAKVPGVKCIVVEDSENHRTVHVTVFVDPLTEDARSAVYAIERDTIDANPNLAFDFHVRRADETSGKTPALAASDYYFVVWGAIDDAHKG